MSQIILKKVKDIVSFKAKSQTLVVAQETLPTPHAELPDAACGVCHCRTRSLPSPHAALPDDIKVIKVPKALSAEKQKVFQNTLHPTLIPLKLLNYINMHGCRVGVGWCRDPTPHPTPRYLFIINGLQPKVKGVG